MCLVSQNDKGVGLRPGKDLLHFQSNFSNGAVKPIDRLRIARVFAQVVIGARGQAGGDVFGGIASIIASRRRRRASAANSSNVCGPHLEICS